MKSYKRNLIQRLFGIPFTGLIEEPAWTYDSGVLKVALDRVPELLEQGGGIRIESDEMPVRVLIIHGDDGEYRAYENRCGHGGRRVDHVSGNSGLMCCSLGKSAWDYEGKNTGGPAETPLRAFRVENEDGVLVVILEESESSE